MNDAPASGTRVPALPRFALFEYGFRPFFLMAGVAAVVIVPAWLYLLDHASAFGRLPMMSWHAHEMIYGFVMAAVAGFMLTAVPSWTGARGFRGIALIALVVLWLAGRIAMATLGTVPFLLTTVVELSFAPALALLLLPPLLRSANRNVMLLAVLGALWIIDIVFLLALRDADAALASRAMTLAIDIVLILVTIIGGRIVPAFTANAIRRLGAEPRIVSRRWLETAVIAFMIAIALADGFALPAWIVGTLAGLAALAHLARLAGWRSFKTGGESILWVLHVGYAWLPVGLALKACWWLGGLDFAAKWQHALTVGVFGTMILAVMTRASLGHTGRPLAVSRVITLAYLLLTGAALLRVLSAVASAGHYTLMVRVAGCAWTLAFLLYLWVYAPILAGPRADGKPG